MTSLNCKIDESVNFCNVEEPITESGITVEGNDSSQTFTIGDIGDLEKEEHVIIIQLKGDIGQNKVNAPITVKTKIQCKNCGKSCDFTDRFCSRCSSRLIK